MNNEDMSEVFNKLNNIAGENNISPEMVTNLFNMFNKSNTSSDESYNSQNCTNNPDSQNSSFNSNGIDFETIMKMKSIIDNINIKDDPRSNLLQSLKPYLKNSRKSKVDQYIQLMNMSKVLDIFPFIGGDQKK